MLIMSNENPQNDPGTKGISMIGICLIAVGAAICLMIIFALVWLPRIISSTVQSPQMIGRPLPLLVRIMLGFSHSVRLNVISIGCAAAAFIIAALMMSQSTSGHNKSN